MIILTRTVHLQRFLILLITKTIGHRQAFLFSHLTYLMQLLYPGNLSRPKYHEFSLKLLIFSMLQYQDVNVKMSSYYFTLLYSTYGL